MPVLTRNNRAPNSLGGGQAGNPAGRYKPIVVSRMVVPPDDSVYAASAGSLDLGGSSTPQAAATVVGRIDFAGAVPAGALAGAAGTLTLTGAAPHIVYVEPAGVITLTGPVAASAGATTGGFLALDGVTLTAPIAAAMSGVVSLAGTPAGPIFAAAGTITLTGATAATAAAATAGVVNLSGSATTGQPTAGASAGHIDLGWSLLGPTAALTTGGQLELGAFGGTVRGLIPVRKLFRTPQYIVPGRWPNSVRKNVGSVVWITAGVVHQRKVATLDTMNADRVYLGGHDNIITDPIDALTLEAAGYTLVDV